MRPRAASYQTRSTFHPSWAHVDQNRSSVEVPNPLYAAFSSR